jgi:uncharacterized membrane protein
MNEEVSGESKVIAAISYFFGLMIALVIYLIKKEDNYVRFHAMQAILFDLAIMVVSFPMAILLFGGFFLAAASKSGIVLIAIWAAFILFALLTFLLRVIFVFKAFTGSRFKLPIIGAHAEKIAAG